MKKVLNLFKKTHETTDEQPAYPAALERTYRISKKVLGVGSFAVVKECIHKQSGTPYALKIILKKAIAGKLPCLLWHSFLCVVALFLDQRKLLTLFTFLDV